MFARRLTLPCALLIITLVSGLIAQETAKDEVDTATAPVELDGVELFRVRGVSSYLARERAEDIRKRLIELAAEAGRFLGGQFFDGLALSHVHDYTRTVARRQAIKERGSSDPHHHRPLSFNCGSEDPRSFRYALTTS